MKKGKAREHVGPTSPKSKPHTVNTAAGRLKTFYCLMNNRGLLDMGNLKSNTTPDTAICS